MILVEFLLLHHLQKNLLVFVLPWRHPEQHFVAQYSQREEIGFGGIVGSLEGLWGHVSWSSHVYFTRQAFFAYNRKPEITDFPIWPCLKDVRRFQVSMQHFILHEIPISGKNLFHDAQSSTFRKFLMLFDESIEGTVWTVFQNEIKEMGFFDYLEAFDDIGVIQLTMHLHLLPQQLHVMFVLTHPAPIDHFDSVLSSYIFQTATKIDLAGISLANQVLLLVLVLLYADLSFRMRVNKWLGWLRGQVFEQLLRVGPLYSLLPVGILGIVHITDNYDQIILYRRRRSTFQYHRYHYTKHLIKKPISTCIRPYFSCLHNETKYFSHMEPFTNGFCLSKQPQTSVILSTFTSSALSRKIGITIELIPSWEKIVLLISLSKAYNFIMQDNFPGLPINENARCLAVHRVKARIIRDGFLKEGSIHQQQNIANKVIKFSTLMSQKMLSKIETKELQQFQKQMIQYCRSNASEIRSSELLSNGRNDSSQKEGKISHFLEQIKKSTKISIQRDKNRAKTHQRFDEGLNIQSAKHSLKVRLPEKANESSPLGNMKIKQALETTKRKNHPKSNFKLHGKGMNSHLLNLLDKLEEMEYIEKMRSRKEELGEDDPQEYILGPTSHLKKEKERLSTALEGQTRSKFMPLGRMTKALRKVYEKQQMNISNEENTMSRMSNNRKVIHYQGRKQRRTEPSLHNSRKGKASFQLQEGLPTPVRQSAPYKGLAYRRQSLKNCIISKDKVSGNSISRIFNVSRHHLDKTPLGYQQ